MKKKKYNIIVFILQKRCLNIYTILQKNNTIKFKRNNHDYYFNYTHEIVRSVLNINCL